MVIGARSVSDYMLRNVTTVEDVEYVKEVVQVGDKVKAEVWYSSPTQHEGRFFVEEVTILRKYSHLALTDKGSATWSDIAVHNPQFRRR